MQVRSIRPRPPLDSFMTVFWHFYFEIVNTPGSAPLRELPERSRYKVMDAKRMLIIGLAGLLAGCATGGGKGLRMASQSQFCPSGTVMVCSGLYEPERELAPSCGCATVLGSR